MAVRPAAAAVAQPGRSRSHRVAARVSGTGEPLARILERALHAQGLSRKLDRALPPHMWAEAVGEGIAARARPTVLREGVLHVLVEDHRWRDQLDAARLLLIERVNGRLGRPLVRELRFGLAHAGSLPPPRLPTPDAAFAAAPGEAPAVAGSACLPDELREALLGAAGAARRSSARSAGPGGG